MLINIVTGIAAGALHVVAGVDHLVAMAPIAIRHPQKALRNGLAWGFGHSAGVLFLSTIAILVKDFTHIELMSSFAEFSVGVALMVVGVIAIRTSLGLNIHTHTHTHTHEDVLAHDHIHLHFRGRNKHNRHPHTSTSLGLLHGLAGASHLLAVFPALALPPIGAVGYMAAYLFGSIITMGVFLMVISMATMKVGRKAFPLIVGSAGWLSVFTGLFWLQNSLSF